MTRSPLVGRTWLLARLFCSSAVCGKSQRKETGTRDSREVSTDSLHRPDTSCALMATLDTSLGGGKGQKGTKRDKKEQKGM